MTPTLDDLLLNWEEARERGEPVGLDELCRDCPDQTAELARRVRRLQALDRLFGSDPDERPGDATPFRPGRPAPSLPRLAGYEVLAELGRGGMGVVYEGYDSVLKRRVALKVLSPALGLGGADDPLAHRFAREARVLAQLRHENIVPVFDAELHDGQPFFVMELIEGGPLRDRIPQLAQGPLGPCLELILGIARGVEHAHGQGVLHRDLKPSNILLDPDGRPRVADFGLARLVDRAEHTPVTPGALPPAHPALEGATQVTVPGHEPGTPAYMAPEQFDPALGPVGRPTDVWALGAILYELLTGQRPFSGKTREELAVQVRGGPPLPPGVIRPAVPAELSAVCLKCLARDPGARYAGVTSLIADLEACQRGEAPSAYVVGRVGRAWRVAKKRRAVLAAGALVVGLGPLVALADWPEWRYQFQTFPARRQLQVGELADLSPRKGRMPFRARTSAVTTEALTPEIVRFTTKALDPALIELLTETGIDRYSLEVEMRHDASQHGQSQVGVYVAYSRHLTASGPHHLMCLMGFADRGQNSTSFPGPDKKFGAKAMVCYFHLGGRGDKPMLFYRYQQGTGVWYPTADYKQVSPWRTLRAWVDGETFTLEWLGQRVTAAPSERRAYWFDAVLELSPELEGVELGLPPRGAIGLYLYGGSLSVRRFRVQPLPAAGG